MTASFFPRHRNAILVAALGAIVLVLALTATVAVVERLPADIGPACLRLLPRVPGSPPLPRAMPWRLASCLRVQPR